MKGKKISVLTQLIIVGLLLGACGSKDVAKTESSAESVGELQEAPTIEMTSAPEAETKEQGTQAELQQEISDSVTAEQNMSANFYYIIEDVFKLIDIEAVVVVGKNENSPLYVGAEVDILSESGRIPSKVLAMEVYRELVDYVEMGSNVGVMLEGVSVEQLEPGNLLVLRNQGMVAEEAFAIVIMLPTPTGEKQTLSEGQSLNLIMLADPIKATITTTDLLSEAEDGDIVLIGLSFEHPIPFQDRQAFTLRDSNGNSVAAGYFVFE